MKGGATSRSPAPPAAAAAAAVVPHASASQTAERVVAMPPVDSAVVPREGRVTPTPAVPAKGPGAPKPSAERAVVVAPPRQQVRSGPEALEAAFAALNQLRVVFRDGDDRAVDAHLGLLSGWLQAEESVQATWSQASAAVAEGREEAASAARARETAEAQAASSKKRRREAEDELKTLHEESAKHALELERLEKELQGEKAETSRLQEEQLADRASLEKLKTEAEEAKASQAKREDELKAREDALAASEKTATVGREALAAFELEARRLLRIAYGEGFEEPLATPEDGATGLLAALVKALGDVASAIGQLADTEGRSLLTSALAQVCGHFFLRDPSFDLATLSQPLATSLGGAAAECVAEKVKELVEAFLPAAADASEEAEADAGASGDA